MTFLQHELDTFRTAWAERVGPDITTLIADDIGSLRNSGILDRVIKVGAQFPTLSLPGANGEAVNLAALIAAGPVVVTFYRGGWCPYCNLELRAYQQRLAEFQALGATLVAVSPERPDASLDTAQKNALAFPVLSDSDGKLADALGIRFQLTPTIQSLYQKFGHDLPTRHGGGDWALPMPGTFVVAKGGQVLASFVDPDYRVRMDPEAALVALRHSKSMH